jgi:hypothetical protein
MRFMVMVKATGDSKADDFGADVVPGLREQEERLRAQMAGERR